MAMRFPWSARLFVAPIATVLAVAPALGCSAAADDTGSTSGGGKGSGAAAGGSQSSGSAPPLQVGGTVPDLVPFEPDPPEPEECKAVLELTIRDFTSEHPDFEAYRGLNDIGCGMVAPTLGPDFKPTFVSGLGTQKRVVADSTFTACVEWDWMPQDRVITSQASFDQWYRDVEGTNQAFIVPITLEDVGDGSGNLVYDNRAFFPIDGMGFGDTPNQQHNYSFTTEGHVKFEYVKGQKFTFRGDDDLWIYVNGKLALDLGGTHMPIAATIDFDAQAAALGIVPGGRYQMDIFHAERHTSESNFRVETNIRCFEPVPVVR